MRRDRAGNAAAVAGAVAAGSRCVYGRRSHSRLRTSDRCSGIGSAIEPGSLRDRRRRILESRLRKFIVGDTAGRASFKDTGDHRTVRRRKGVLTGTIRVALALRTFSDSMNRPGRHPSAGRGDGRAEDESFAGDSRRTGRAPAARDGIRRFTGARIRTGMQSSWRPAGEARMPPNRRGVP